jgi:hypothetical protein
MQWFFPFGNTAAVSLSQDVPPGMPINALLLGNGDARNILFTLFNDQQPRKDCSSTIANRSFLSLV